MSKKASVLKAVPSSKPASEAKDTAKKSNPRSRGTSGQNWTESESTARQGRYGTENQISSPNESPTSDFDTDISQAV